LASHDNLPIPFEIILKKSKSALEPPVGNNCNNKRGGRRGNHGWHHL